jgi:homogentisate 1,2-dioxygenase
MALASLDDINIHLPRDKIEVDTADYVPFQLDAERVVRGMLAGYYLPVTLSTWTAPETTPGLIRAIVGRLVAAFYYRQRYSEDSLDDPLFAQNKYNEAMELLKGVLDGNIVLEEVPTDVGADHLTTDDFWPNDSTDEPKFTMGMNL